MTLSVLEQLTREALIKTILVAIPGRTYMTIVLRYKKAVNNPKLDEITSLQYNHQASVATIELKAPPLRGLRQLSKKNQWRLSALLSVGISAHLVAETLRRFFEISDIAYAIADITVVVAALIAVRLGGLRFDKAVFAFFALYVFWGIVSHVPNNNSLLLIFVGIRPLIIGFSLYMLAENAFRHDPDAAARVSHVLAIWLLLIVFVAIYQIYAGAEAPINQIADVARGGRGDVYGGLDWLFRPTSIFMHTGRFGQYIFFLGMVFVLPLLFKRSISWRSYFFAMIAFLGIVVSGQRAAFVILTVIFLAVLLQQKRAGLLLRISSILLLLTVIFFSVSADIRDALTDRLGAAFFMADDRLTEQSAYWDVGFLRYWLTGEGLGFFSFGAEIFGGAIYYEYMRQFGGGGENSWLSIQGEAGLLGMIFFGLALYAMVYIAYRRKMLETNLGNRGWHTAAMYMPLALAVWALTHHVFSNYLQMTALFFLFGASSGLAAKIHRVPYKDKGYQYEWNQASHSHFQ